MPWITFVLTSLSITCSSGVALFAVTFAAIDLFRTFSGIQKRLRNES